MNMTSLPLLYLISQNNSFSFHHYHPFLKFVLFNINLQVQKNLSPFDCASRPTDSQLIGNKGKLRKFHVTPSLLSPVILYLLYKIILIIISKIKHSDFPLK